MRRVRQSLDRAELPAYERIIGCYCPYVLIRCARYTNGRRQAQQIGAYALTTACVMLRKLGDAVPIGKIVEMELRVIGPDVLRGARGEDWRDGPDEPLLVGPWMQYMATALNALKRPGREVLILHHIDGMELGDLARLLEQPVDEVQARLGRAERRLAQWLATPDIRPALTRFAAALDHGWMQEVAGYAMAYLSANAMSADR